MSETRPVPSAGGARRAVRARRPWDRTVVAAVLLVVVAAGLVLLAPRGAQPGTEAGPASLAVRHLSLGCPGAAPGADRRPVVRLGSAPLDTSTGGTVRVAAGGRASTVELAPGELTGAPVEPRAGVALEATEAAAGLFAVQSHATGRTLSGTRCSAPAATWWFAAAGGSLTHSSELVLDNLDPGPAVVDVRILGPAGPVDGPDGRGLTVPPGERLVVPLTELAPQGEDLTVAVTATRGRVVAAMADRFADRVGADAGAAWLPVLAGPRRVHRLPGLVPDADGHTLVVSNTGDSEALVDLQVSGEAGTVTPTGETQLRVAPGSVLVRDVGELLPDDAGALVVRASEPVVATVRVTTGTDTAYLVPPAELGGPGAVTVPDDGDATLALAAGDAGGRATVASYDETGAQLATATVDIGPGATVRTAPARRAAFVVVTADRGRLRAAMTWSRRSGVEVLPVPELPLRVRQPAVRPAY